MKSLLLILLLSFLSCNQPHVHDYKLDYPRNINDIKEVVLERPDKKTHGKFAQIQKLSRNEIGELLNGLTNIESVGPMKFDPDYYIIFKTNLEYKRLKINGNKIKGYENDSTYKIGNLKFLEDF